MSEETAAYIKSLEEGREQNAEQQAMFEQQHRLFLENIALEKEVLRLQKEAAELQIQYYRGRGS